VRAARRGQPAEPGDPQAERAPGLQRDRGVQGVEIADVRADRGADPALQAGVRGQVVGRERALERQQAVGVERLERGEVLRCLRVGAGGVGDERQRRVGAPHGPHRLDVPAGADLDRDPGESGRDISVHPGHQRLERGVHGHLGADDDRSTGAAERVRERDASAPAPQVPAGDVDRGGGPPGASQIPYPRHVLRPIPVQAEQRRRQPLFDVRPGGVGVGVAGDARLAPAGHTVIAGEPDENALRTPAARHRHAEGVTALDSGHAAKILPCTAQWGFSFNDPPSGDQREHPGSNRSPIPGAAWRRARGFAAALTRWRVLMR
jgi:hypothetical protein